ncbi:MAG TPA: acetyl-CoA carboxylase biotin carboxyl carrier protein [Thermoanaerobaculia bacterium]|nr:acetyl-CoA carboxylase biotin carboxyl carrier protein [Thermoanaerobaculia bacterium]
MNFKEILELIDKVAESGIGSVEVEQAGTKVRIEGKNTAPPVVHNHVSSESSAPPQSAPPQTAAQIETARVEERKRADEALEAGLHVMTSPIVGTFYRSSNPEAPPFVNVGDRVTKGQVLCIIEAMKLMNEIESDVDGVIVTIYPQNGQPVEYGEKLFAVKV